MAKRAARTTTSTRARVDSVKTGAMPEPDVAGRPNGKPSDDEVRVRAYHRYLERGAVPGNDVEDWVEAERELRIARQS